MTCNFISGAAPGRGSRPVTPGILHRVVRHRDPSHQAPRRDWKAGLNTSHLSRSPQRHASHRLGTFRYIRPARPVLKQALAPQARARFKYHRPMGLFRRRPPRQEYAVSAEVLWGALKAGLPTVTSQATFYAESHRVEWTMDLSAFDWPERMSARVEASRDGCAVVTVEGKSAYGTGAKSIVGPGRRKKAAAALLAAVSAVISQSGGATARPPADDDGYR